MKTPLKPQRSIAQLAFARRALVARLDVGGHAEDVADELLQEIEGLDLKIAQSPAATLQDLAVKIDRLADLLEPGVSTEGESLEAVFLHAIRRDARRLSSAAL